MRIKDPPDPRLVFPVGRILAGATSLHGKPWPEVRFEEVLCAPRERSTLKTQPALRVASLLQLDGTTHNAVHEPLRGQPRTGVGQIDNCSGYLVGPDRVMTAGHCVDDDGDAESIEYSCVELYSVIFDWADQGPITESGTLTIDADDVYHCEYVEFDGYNDPSITLPTFNPQGAGDYAVLRLAVPVQGRLPLITERVARTDGDDEVLVLGHPLGLPLKAEFTVREPGTTTTRIQAHALGGSSGSGVVGMETGKIAQNLTSAPAEWPSDDTDPGGACKVIDFTTGTQWASGARAEVWNAHVPPLGLQVEASNAATEAVFYGPITTQADYQPFEFKLSVPVNGLPAGATDLSWSIGAVSDFEVITGGTSGSLEEGEHVYVQTKPSAAAMASPGLKQAVIPFVDHTYQTHEPVLYSAYVGIEGFTLTDYKDILGEGELGVPHGTAETLMPRNRWIVTQSVTISATEDWVVVDGFGGTTPQSYLLPGIFGFPGEHNIPMEIDGTNLSPGVREATLTVSSDDSGSPSFAYERQVRFDHCRQVNALQGSWQETIPPGEDDFAEFTATADPPLGVVDDVDVIVVATTGVKPTPAQAFSVVLVGPDGTEVVLKGDNDPLLKYYDDDNVTLLVPLGDFDGKQAAGQWKLRFENNSASDDLEVDLSRWEVRLHVDQAPNCE